MTENKAFLLFTTFDFRVGMNGTTNGLFVDENENAVSQENKPVK